MSLLEWCVVLTAVFIGACAQGSFGFGLGVTAAPILALVDDSFVPGPLLMVALVLTILVVSRERRAASWRPMAWAFVGRVPGSVLGTWAVVVMSKDTLIVLFGALVLIGVALSLAGLSVEPTKGSLLAAGAASGFMGSITSIGGPPMALLYQRRSGSELRANLSLFFLFGTALSVALLLGTGSYTSHELAKSAQLLPAMLAGFAASRWVARLLDGDRLRSWLLGFSGSTAVLLLITELF